MITNKKRGIKKLLVVVILALGIFAVLCIPQVMQISHAQGHSYHSNSHNGMATLAEHELRVKENEARRVKQEQELNVTARNITEVKTEKEYSQGTEREATPRK